MSQYARRARWRTAVGLTGPGNRRGSGHSPPCWSSSPSSLTLGPWSPCRSAGGSRRGSGRRRKRTPGCRRWRWWRRTPPPAHWNRRQQMIHRQQPPDAAEGAQHIGSHTPRPGRGRPCGLPRALPCPPTHRASTQDPAAAAQEGPRRPTHQGQPFERSGCCFGRHLGWLRRAGAGAGWAEEYHNGTSGQKVLRLAQAQRQRAHALGAAASWLPPSSLHLSFRLLVCC